jgi:hypothetical protein
MMPKEVGKVTAPRGLGQSYGFDFVFYLQEK